MALAKGVRRRFRRCPEVRLQHPTSPRARAGVLGVVRARLLQCTRSLSPVIGEWNAPSRSTAAAPLRSGGLAPDRASRSPESTWTAWPLAAPSALLLQLCEPARRSRSAPPEESPSRWTSSAAGVVCVVCRLVCDPLTSTGGVTSPSDAHPRPPSFPGRPSTSLPVPRGH